VKRDLYQDVASAISNWMPSDPGFSQRAQRLKADTFYSLLRHA